MIPFLHHQSQPYSSLKASSDSELLPPSFFFFFFFCKGPLWFDWACSGNAGCVPIWRSTDCKLSSICSPSFPLPRTLTHSQVLGIRAWGALWGRFCAYHSPFLCLSYSCSTLYTLIIAVSIWDGGHAEQSGDGKNKNCRDPALLYMKSEKYLLAARLPHLWIGGDNIYSRVVKRIKLYYITHKKHFVKCLARHRC